MRTRILPIIASLFLCWCTPATAQDNDSDLLGKALEYYGGQKYHEALLIFYSLKSRYKLNPRFIAYMGVCEYKEQNYEEASSLLHSVMKYIEPFPPHEKALYYYATAESLFFIAKTKEEQRLEQEDDTTETFIAEFDSAACYYQKALYMSHNNERGDILFKLGFCSLLKNDNANATDYFMQADVWYDRYGSMDPETAFRRRQVKNMLRTLTRSASNAQDESSKQKNLEE